MSTNKEETLRQFCDVTGADESRSKFFLESSNWQLDVALSSFYEHGGNADEAPAANPAAAVSSLPTLSDSDMESPPGSPLQAQKKDKKKVPSSKFATLDSLQQDSSSDEEEGDSPHVTSSPMYGHSMFIANEIEKKIPRNMEASETKAKPLLSSQWIMEQTQMVVQKFFYNQEPSCSIKKPPKYVDQGVSSSNRMDNISPSESETKHEIENLKKEIERLLYENSALRKEIARLNGENNDASQSQHQSQSHPESQSQPQSQSQPESQNQNQWESGQAFYAGGSERSGQQILGPGKGRKDIVTEVFKSVRERGAVVFEDEPSSTSRGRSVFGGVGYRLGQTPDDHEPASAAGEQPAAGQADAPRSVRLRLYREGFTVDSGPLRSYTDPDHAEFLNCIRRGVIPTELVGAGGGEVRVSLEDRRHEECPRNVAKSQPFTGKGHLLGSPTPVTVGATGAVAADPSDRAANLRAAQDNVLVDAAQPTTTIQFRLADGSRLTGRFNHTHTVADLHEYITRAEPSYQLQSFVLLTTFPSTELGDPTATLVQANILNTTLLQRLK